MALIDFTLSNARRFYLSMGNPLGWKGLKLFLWWRVGNIISCHVHNQRGATLCYTVARTGPLEIMYRKIKNAPAHLPPLSFMFPASPLRYYSFVSLFLKPLGDPLQDSSVM